MAKAALEALAATLAKEERQNGIHVNVVAPGLVETDMGIRLARAFTGDRSLQDLRSLDADAPFGRVCQPADVAAAVVWLCSEGAGYVTGQRIQVDGGGPSKRPSHDAAGEGAGAPAVPNRDFSSERRDHLR